MAKSARQMPIGRIIRAHTDVRDPTFVFAAQFSLSHACYLITYPAAGWFGLGTVTIALPVLAVVGLVRAGVTWPEENE